MHVLNHTISVLKTSYINSFCYNFYCFTDFEKNALKVKGGGVSPNTGNKKVLPEAEKLDNRTYGVVLQYCEALKLDDIMYRVAVGRILS